MHSYESFDQQLDCRGMQCPAPILQIAKAARALRGKSALIEILADDAAFPEDIKRWCTSSGATLVALNDHNGAFQAKIRLGQPDAPAVTQAKSPITGAQAAPTPSLPQINCRGMQCPAPILQLAKAMRSADPGQQVEVLADDAAFPEDVKSWCASSGATLIALDADGAGWRARIQRAGQPVSPQPATPAHEPSAPVAAPPMAAPSVASQLPTLRVSLRGLDERAALERLDAVVHAYEPGERVVLESNDADFATQCMRWLGVRGHQLEQLDTRQRPARAELVIGQIGQHAVGATSAPQSDALVRVEPARQKRCTMLILRNDFEALMAALLVANGAAAQGMEVTIFFSFWGLNLLRGESMERELELSQKGWFGRLWASLMPSRTRRPPTSKASLAQRMFKMMMPSGPRRQALGKLNFGGMGSAMLQRIMREQRIMSLPEMLAAAVEQNVRFIACTMSMGVMGIAKEDLMELPNMVYGGVATFVEEASRADMSMVF